MQQAYHRQSHLWTEWQTVSTAIQYAAGVPPAEPSMGVEKHNLLCTLRTEAGQVANNQFETTSIIFAPA